MSTRNFSDLELRCRCGCGMLPPQEAQDELQLLRDVYGKPIHISSAARCPEHNARVSSTGRDGPHTIAAFDLRAHGVDARTLTQAAAAIGLYRALQADWREVPELLDPQIVEDSLRLAWSGLGVSQKGNHGQRFIHVDHLHGRRHPRPWMWSY